MKFSFALAAALILPVLGPVNAQDNYSEPMEPSSARGMPAAPPASSALPVNPAQPASRAPPPAPPASSAPVPYFTVPEIVSRKLPSAASSPVSPSHEPSTTTSASSPPHSVPTSTSTTTPSSSASHAPLPSTTTIKSASSAYPTIPASTSRVFSSSAPHTVLPSTITTSTSRISSVYPTPPASTTTTEHSSPTPPTVKASTTTTGRPSSASPAAPPASTTQIRVQVAPGGQLTYDPPSFNASKGTVVTFFFSTGYKRYSIAHSITQGSFAHPCMYLAAAGGKPAGFDSGLQTGGQFSIKITDDKKPIWFFCKADKHCGQGMVGAINSRPTGETYNAFLAAAKALGQNQSTLSDNGPVMGGLGATVLALGMSSPTTSPSAPGSATTPPASLSSSPSSSSSRLAANGFFAPLAAILGITLVLFA